MGKRLRMGDYGADLLLLALPFAAVATPLLGAYAYAEGHIGKIPMVLSIALMCLFLRMLADPPMGLESTFIFPFAAGAMMLHFLLICMGMMVAVPYLIILLIGLLNGGIPAFESVLFIVFMFANAAYAMSLPGQ